MATVSDEEPAGPAPRDSVVGFTWPSALVLAVAVWCYWYVYGPRRAQADWLDARLALARQRVARLHEQRDRLRERVEVLAAADRETVLEAVREQLCQAPSGEWLP